MDWSPFLGAFSGTAVEFFETAVIAYAIVRAGFAREAWSAVAISHVVVFVAAIFLFPFHQLVPTFWLRLMAGMLLTTMGLYWAAKSIKRIVNNKRPQWATNALGKFDIPEEDNGQTSNAFSLLVFLVMLKSAFVEAAEIVVVVIPIAASSGALFSVVVGVVAAIVVICLLAYFAYGLLRNVPEVKVKLVVGVFLSALGTWWLAELALF